LNPLKEYNIGFVGLPLGKHQLNFSIGEEFFACFDTSEVEKGQLILNLLIEKQNNMMIFDFLINGFVELTCDRCVEPYNQKLDFENTLYVKFGEEYTEQTDEIVIIPSSSSHFDISQYVYEYIHLALPMQHLHGNSQDEGEGCNPKALEYIEKYKRQGGGNGEIDSPWKALESLKFKEDN
jgi:uncharacterized metal-binding protein YceD (DUF177 family)